MLPAERKKKRNARNSATCCCSACTWKCRFASWVNCVHSVPCLQLDDVVILVPSASWKVDLFRRLNFSKKKTMEIGWIFQKVDSACLYLINFQTAMSAECARDCRGLLSGAESRGADCPVIQWAITTATGNRYARGRGERRTNEIPPTLLAPVLWHCFGSHLVGSVVPLFGAVLFFSSVSLSSTSRRHAEFTRDWQRLCAFCPVYFTSDCVTAAALQWRMPFVFHPSSPFLPFWLRPRFPISSPLFCTNRLRTFLIPHNAHFRPRCNSQNCDKCVKIQIPTFKSQQWMKIQSWNLDVCPAGRESPLQLRHFSHFTICYSK